MAIWTFKQLRGPKKTLTLSGWSAPFGRPRQGAVVRTKEVVRLKSVRYPGNSGPPTRHIFGIHYEDIELHGRFRDKDLGDKGAANDKVREVKNFLRDMVPCDISWGDTIHLTGIITEFDPGFESAAEVEWVMKIAIDQDNYDLSSVRTPKPKALPINTVGSALFNATELLSIPAKQNFGISASVLDTLDDLVSDVTGAFGSLVNVANQIADFEDGLAKNASRLLAGIHQTRTALLILVNTMVSAQQDVFFIRDSAKDQIDFQATATAAITQANISLSLLSDLEEQCLASLRGDTSTTVRVQQGDTWESISTKVFGGPQEADKIKKANDAKYGKKPQPGAIVIIPRI